MDKIQKALKAMSKKDRDRITAILIAVRNGENLSLYDMIKLKGAKDLYRIRVGSFRIIFVTNESEKEVISVEKRDDNTYSDLN